MSEEQDELRKQLNKFKAKKKKLTVPKELLESANSYDEKLEAIKYLVDREKSKSLLLIKSLLASPDKLKGK